MKKTIKNIAVIGGSGIYQVEGLNIVKEHDVDTPYGKPSDLIFEASVGESKVFFLPRHGRTHSILPSEINYRANVYALKSLGADAIVSISAVGSFKEELSPGTFFLPDQFIDMTKGKRDKTFFGEGLVGHISAAELVNISLKEKIYKNLEGKLNIFKDGSYICIEGPQLSTKAESNLYKSWGASVIGMTNMPESLLAAEAGIAYSTLAMVTDYDCFRDGATPIEDIIKTMRTNVEIIKTLLPELINTIVKSEISFDTVNDFSVLTPKEAMNERQAEIVANLLS